MKKCPFCAEAIQDAAVKCRFCGEFLEKAKKIPWYFKPYGMLMSFLCFGPLALIPLWINPHWTKRLKWMLTVVILVLSIVLVRILIVSVRSIVTYYRLLFDSISGF